MGRSNFVTLAALAVTSRLFVITLQVLFNLLIPDHYAGVFIAPGQQDRTKIDHVVTFLLGGLKRWDAQYFMHIAQHGYSYENTLAFFPLYPYLMYSAGSTLDLVFGSVASFHTSLLVAGVSINFFLFVISVLCLYQLGCLVLGNAKEAFLAAALFCINPASIFFSACYSETLFSALTFGGLVCLEKKRTFYASALFGLGGLTRSNGLINAGFLVFAYFLEVVELFPDESSDNIFRNVLKKNIPFSINLYLSLSPFFGFQVYAALLYCMFNPLLDPIIPSSVFEREKGSYAPEVYELANAKGFLMPSNVPPPWCNQNFPLSYAYVQRTYWDVGFLRYFELKQLPNFLLAAPLLVLLGSKCFAYFRILFYGLRLSYSNVFVILRDRKFVYFVHTATLLVFGTFFAHVQVVTRLLASSSPILYWIASSQIRLHWTTVTERVKFNEKEDRLIYYRTCLKVLLKYFPWSTFIIVYFVTFTIVGTALHVNLLPWT